MLKLAVVFPPDVASVPWPILVPPSEKVTRPVALTEPPTVTVAVKITLWPNCDGLREDTISVLVLALPTVMLFVDGEPRVTVFGAHSRVHYEQAFEPFLSSV